MAEQCAIGITRTINLIQIHLGDHAVHGYRVWSMKIQVQCLLGFALSKSLTEHTVRLTFQTHVSLKDMTANRPSEGEP